MPRFPDALSDEGQGDAAVFPRRFAFSGPSGPRPAGGDIPPLPPGPEAVFFGPRNRYVNLPAFRKQAQTRFDPFDMGDDDGMLFDIAGSRTEPAKPDRFTEPGESYTPSEIGKTPPDPWPKKLWTRLMLQPVPREGSRQKHLYYGHDLHKIKGHHAPVGQISSARYPGQHGTIPYGYEATSNDVMSDTNPSLNSASKKSTTTFDFHGVKIVPRKSWAQYRPRLTGYDPLVADRTPNQPYNKVTLHHSGSYETPQGIEDFHRGAKMWFGERLLREILHRYSPSADIGYNYVITKGGKIYEGRSLKYEGAHTGGHNQDNIGIVFAGNYKDTPLTETQIGAYMRLMKALNAQYSKGKKKLPVYSHGYFTPKKDSELRGAQKQLARLGVIFDQPDFSP